jgi:hypothetical protein
LVYCTLTESGSEICPSNIPIWGINIVGAHKEPNDSSSPTAGGGSGGAQPKDTNEKRH